MKPLVLAAVALALVVLAGIAYYTAASAQPPVPGRQIVAAPIDGLDVVVAGSQATLHIKAGLPSGCAKRDGYTVDRAADTITVSVTNTMPTGNPVCTMIYGTYDLSIDLGTNFVVGRSYVVRVNDKNTTFTP